MIDERITAHRSQSNLERGKISRLQPCGKVAPLTPRRFRQVCRLGHSRFANGEINNRGRGSECIEHEIPKRVFISADAGFGHDEYGDELDDLVERADTHAHENDEGGQRPGEAAFDSQVRSQQMIADQGGRPESEEVNPLVVAQDFGDELHLVEDAIADADVAPCHVHQSPSGQPPEDGLIELDAVLFAEDQGGDEDHDTGVEDELIVGALQRDRGEDRDVDDVDDEDRSILLSENP